MSPLQPSTAVEFPFQDITQREALGDLLDHSFGVTDGRHFFEDFPIWDPSICPAGPKLVRLGAWSHDRLVASAGMRLSTLALADGSEVQIAMIGAVATDSAYRGRGLASKLTSELTDRATRAGATFALLWGSEHRMYARLGFELAGSQIRARLARLDLAGAHAASAPTIVEGWNDEIFALLRQRGRGVVIAEEDLRWYRAHRHVQWFRAERAGRISAYAAFGRGIDLENIVHEWGGDPASLAPLLGKILELYPEAELLGPADTELFGLNKHSVERLALVKNLRPPSVSPALWVWGLDAV